MFEENLKNLVTRIDSMKDNIHTEEATKTSIVMPFFQILGYDVFNPMEFIPEYTADVGIKKGEKVDYAIKLNGELIILIEAKAITEPLEKHDSQLFRYFGTTPAKFAILTNGLEYRFFTDLDEQNKMDSTPFFSINLLELKDNQIVELKKFCKENFDLSKILDTASELKYLGLIKNVLKNEFANPSEDFVKLILNKDVYDGMKTQAIIEKYTPIVKKSISQYINELVNDKIQNALNSEDHASSSIDTPQPEEDSTDEEISDIVTTEDEIQAFYIVKAILSQVISPDRISYKDTKSYFNILVDNKTTKWVCRLYFKKTIKFIVFEYTGNGNEEKNVIDNLDDIYKLSDKIIEKAKQITAD